MIKGILKMLLGCACIVLCNPSFGQLAEAENGVLTGTTLSTQHAGFSGSGYVTGFDADGDKVTISISASGGIYNLYVRYAAPSGDKFNFVYVNGENLGSAAFPQTSVFKETRVGKVYLKTGVNTIAIVKEWGYFEVDNIRIEPADPSPIYNLMASLVTASPSARADSLYALLSSVYGKVILSGQYGGTTELNRIQTVSGRLPVVRGFDLIDYSPSRVERGATSTEVEKAIQWDGERGIVTFCWHWNAPKDLIDQPGKEWWRGFYTEATTFDVTRAMTDPQSEEYVLILRDIDAIAIQLKRLQEAGVPVIWRPLHEAEGKWFWWGAKGAEACKWLWQLLFERLVNHHHVDNLIWTWTSTDKPGALDWYPGDAYVDMIGADIYLPAGTHGSSFLMYDNLAALYGGKKIIALSENGPMPDAEKLFVEGAAWSWFATWSGDFVTGGTSNSAAHINTVFNHDYVITLDEIDSIGSIVARLEKLRDEIADDSIVVHISGEKKPVVIYHNPITNGQLTLSIKNVATPTKVLILDLQGKLVLSAESQLHGEQIYKFDFSNKDPGVYMLRIVTPQFTRVIRVIKQ